MNDDLKLSSKGPEFLLYLMHHSAYILREAGLPAESAKDIAIEIAARMAEQLGGHQIYLAKGKGYCNTRNVFCFRLEELDWKIYREFNGSNRDEICGRYGISTPRLYQIIAACRQKTLDRRNLTPIGPLKGRGPQK